MRALIVTEFGPTENLSLSDAPEPAPGPGQVTIAVRAAGIGFVDALIAAGLYQVKPDLPFIPGSEVAGEVITLGDGVKNLKPGDRVMGFAQGGALAEQALLPAAAAIPIPDALGNEQAAGFLLNYCTALFGLKMRGLLRPGEKLLVLGAAGGVGLAAIDVARALGAKVFAAASTGDKRRKAIEQGADTAIDYTDPDWRKALTEAAGGPIDMVYDPVGGDFSETALRCLAPGGRFLVIGFAAGDIPRMPLNLVLLKQCQVVGVDWGGWMRADPARNIPLLQELVQLVSDGKLQPLAPITYPLEKAGQALADLRDRKTIGKPVIVP